MMISLMPSLIIIGSSASELTVAQLLLVVGVGIVIGLIICFFMEHNIGDIIDWFIEWFKNKFRSKKEKK